MKFRYGAVVGIPSPPLEERARERRPFVSKFVCHDTGAGPPYFARPESPSLFVLHLVSSRGRIRGVNQEKRYSATRRKQIMCKANQMTRLPAGRFLNILPTAIS